MSRVEDHIAIALNVPRMNGRAEGSATARLPDGGSIREHGNWQSSLTRSRFAAKVAEHCHPPTPKRRGESAKAYAERRRALEVTRAETARHVEASLCDALDQHEKDASDDTSASESARDGAGTDRRPYVETPDGLFRRKDEHLAQMTNFTARITAYVVTDDGVEASGSLGIRATLGGTEHRFNVKVGEFSAMNWPLEHMGPGAIVYPGASTKDHVRVAIQAASHDFERRTVYAHTGWREVGGRMVYLHAGGAIGENGPAAGVDVSLPAEALANYRLPDPPSDDELRRCVRASLGLLSVARPHVSVPVFCGIYRAPLGPCDSAIHLSGLTGTFKSELAGLAQQHFGAAMDARHLPAGWGGTDNALEGMLFAVKDSFIVIDDFKPGGGPQDVRRWHQKADRIFRAVGNHVGRQRMRADSTLRASKPPRAGMILSTGEDLPDGHSCRARMLVVEVAGESRPGAGDGDVDAGRLTAAQRWGRDGLFAGAMAGYLRWLAPRVAEVQRNFRSEIEALRESVGGALHRRTPEVVANLATGLRHFLDYARDVGAVDEGEAAGVFERGWAVLVRAAERQAEHQVSSEPTTRFIELLAAAIASGNAHLAGPDGQAPAGRSEAWGWRSRSVGTGAYAHTDYEPRGDRVGWVEGDDVYLEPLASYKAAQAMAAGAEGISITPQTLRKRLDEKGMLVREAKRETVLVRKKLDGERRSVLHLRPGALFPPDQPDQPASDADRGPREAGPATARMAGRAGVGPRNLTPGPDTGRPGSTETDAPGPDGQVGQVSATGEDAMAADAYAESERAAVSEPGM